MLVTSHTHTPFSVTSHKYTYLLQTNIANNSVVTCTALDLIQYNITRSRRQAGRRIPPPAYTHRWTDRSKTMPPAAHRMGGRDKKYDLWAEISQQHENHKHA